MVLELLDGEALSARIRKRRGLALMETAVILEQIASALAAAHAQGVVHRDLKPANIYCCRRGSRDDFIKVLDFGISKILNDQNLNTRTGTVLGTPNFMAPEQATGTPDDIDHRTDIFALGAILYQCLTGRMAFDGPSVPGTIYQVCHATPPPIRSLRPDVP